MDPVGSLLRLPRVRVDPRIWPNLPLKRPGESNRQQLRLHHAFERRGCGWIGIFIVGIFRKLARKSLERGPNGGYGMELHHYPFALEPGFLVWLWGGRHKYLSGDRSKHCELLQRKQCLCSY